MKIVEFELDKLAECYEMQEKCRNLNMPIPPVISWEYEVKSKDGSVKERGKGKANSYTRNAYNILSFSVGMCDKALLSSTFGDGHINSKLGDGTVQYSSGTGLYRTYPHNADVRLGTGTTETLNDYVFPAYTCSSTVVSSSFDSETRKLNTSFVGVYTNSTGSTISFTEGGITLRYAADVLMVHDIFAAVDVPDGYTITWTYRNSVAYPNPS